MGDNARMRILAIFFLLILLLNIHIVYAVGISSPYLENNTLKVIKGQSVIYTIQLQNPEDDDVGVNLNYDNTSKIAKIIDFKEAYILPSKSFDTKVMFNITAPKETKIGDIYTISYSLKPLSAGEGLLPLVVGLNKQFNVEIIKGSNDIESDSNANIAMSILSYLPIFIIILIILIILIIFILKRIIFKKSKRPRRSKRKN